MNLFFFFGFTISTASFWLVNFCVTRLQFIFQMFLRFFKEPARIAGLFLSIQWRFNFIRARNDKFSPYNFPITSFQRSWICSLFNVFTGFFPFVKSGNKGQWHFAGPHYYQKILFDQYRLYPSLFQLSFASSRYSQQAYFPAVSLYSQRVCSI